MKLGPRTFLIFWDVHAWAGVLGALVLYVMFFAASFAPFYPELNAWAEPSSTLSAPAFAPGSATAAAVAARPKLEPLLAALVHDEEEVKKDRVAFILGRTGLDAYWSHGRERKYFHFDPETQHLEPSRSRLGSFLFELHYLGLVTSGIYVAGVASMALLLAIVTGVLIHWKDLVAHWARFRPERAVRTWTSDMHKVLGTLGLPYQVFYAWSGAVLCLAWVVVEPALDVVVFRGNATAAAALRGEVVSPGPTGRRAEALPNLDTLVARAQALVPRLEAEWIGVEHAVDEAATVSVYGRVEDVPFGTASVVFRAADGQLLGMFTPSTATALQRFEAWFFGIHYAQFGGHGIKILYALLALATCAVLVTGNVVWLERRDKTRAHPGNRALARFTVAVAAGLPVGTAALFVVNRALPAEAAHRSTLEQTAFAAAWLAVAALAGRVHQAGRVAAPAMLVTSLLFTAAAMLDVFFVAGRPFHLGVDAALIALGVAFGAAGARTLRATGDSTQASRAPLRGAASTGGFSDRAETEALPPTQSP